LATVQLSRHPIDLTRTHYESYKGTFLELLVIKFKDDKAMIGGLGQIDGQSFMIVGQQKESILRCVSIEISGWQIRRL
jgi:acetyl-CoA carboxylase carboxyl transferase subunit alpha